MPLQKQPVNITFSQGLETKTDPYQVPIGKFESLVNSVFTTGGRLTKTNGFGSLPSLPDATATYATTFNGDLTAIGTSLQAYSQGSNSWFNKGTIQPLELSTLPLIRNTLNQIQADSVVAANGLMCTAYSETDGTTVTYKYVVAEVATGQNIIAPTIITEADATYGTPRVFMLGNYFVVVYTNKVVSTYHLKFLAISSTSPTVVTAGVDISTSYTPSTTVNFDGAILNGSLYLAWNGAGSSGVKMAYISSTLSVSSSVNPDASHVATLMSVTADLQNQVIWASYYDLGTTSGYSIAMSPQLVLLAHFPAHSITTGTILNLASIAMSGILTLFYEVSNTASGIQTNLIRSVTVTQALGTVGTPAIVSRAVGLASKAFKVGSTVYFLTVYSSAYQPTFFLMSSTGNIIAKLAYGNSGGYLTFGLPNVSVIGTTASIAYLMKDLIQAVNKNTNVPSGSQTAGVYSQTGVNLANFTIGTSDLSVVEIGENLNISGGFVWAYDGYRPVEQEFFLYPDSVQLTGHTTGGLMTAQQYFYQVTYEWTDNQGNAFRSAPSIPTTVTTSAAISSVTLIIPTLRLTYKTANPVKIVIYRWSVAQQVYYQVTSISAPTLNSTTVDSVTFLDTLADSAILGNNVLYTTGGVLENIAPPATRAMTLFDDRLWLIDAEDPNTLWFSKQVLQATPVEMTDLQTIYVAPTTGAQGSTGDLRCLSAMDDKLILFKKDAIYYLTGTGPDITGSNNQYSPPIFITSSVGCDNQQSIVLGPEGLKFQSDKGTWLLSRSLQTEYIGAPVEAYNGLPITGGVSVPATNQQRFTSQVGTTQMYDYYYGQWGTFSNMPAVSSTLYQGMHTYISSLGQVFQETAGLYLNGSSPVLMSFKTGWINLAGLQGYQRAYFFYLLGTYLSPHKLLIQIAYDYNPNPTQQLIISPSNFAPAYGVDTPYGQGTPYGGPLQLEQWRIFFTQQRCQSVQISVSELYDPAFGIAAGPGLTMSGINCVVGIKKGYRPMLAADSAGG